MKPMTANLIGLAGTGFFAFLAYKNNLEARAEPFQETRVIRSQAATTYGLMALGLGALTGYIWNDPTRLSRLRGRR